jgi:predicted DCC family thiol-disulfide oxidoreductase YuxK
VADDASGPVLMYDGLCGFCNASVQFVLARDSKQTMRFAALQSEYAAAVIGRHPWLEGVDSVVYVEPAGDGRPERVWVRSAAALRVADYLGGAWRLLGVFRVIPAPVRDAAYNLFARYRYRLFGKYDSCQLPPKEVRARFLDAA